MTGVKEYISSYPGITPADAEMIAAYFKPHVLKKGEFYTEQGKSCRQISFVQQGYVRTFLHTDKQEVTQWIGPPGYFITDLSAFMFGLPCRWNIQALTDCEMMGIDRETYDRMGEEVPAWNKVDRLFTARCFIMMEDRMLGQLFMTAEERFVALFQSQPDLFNHVPLQYIASMLGMTPETLSRLRKKMIS